MTTKAGVVTRPTLKADRSRVRLRSVVVDDQEDVLLGEEGAPR